MEYKALDKLRANAEYAANRDYADYEKFGSIIFCNTSFNSRIESANYAKQMELYISGKEADLSEVDTAIKDYENERSKCRDFNPWDVATACNLTVSTILTYEKHNLLIRNPANILLFLFNLLFQKVCSVAYGLLTVYLLVKSKLLQSIIAIVFI